jgi:diguanylate cyclase (GGDEF)-like protein/PAS domain S-box-containing protein
LLEEPGFKGRGRQARVPVRMLLVEDDPQFADLIRTQLRRTAWAESRLEVAGTLAEALTRLGRERFGLVITDLNLPDSAGLATAEALARSGDQVVIVVTGDSDPALRAGALDCGAYDLLTKDQVTAAALERLVRLATIQANTHASLRESESRFRSLIDLSTDWYWEQDEELRFTRFEGNVGRVSGNLPSLAIGRRRWEMPVAPVSCTWEEHRAVLAARQPFRDFEYSRLGEDGLPRYVSASGVPVYDGEGRFRGYRGVATEVTERRRAEEDLRRFRLAMDTSPDMILLVDRASMRHLDVNTTACRLTGYSREELLACGPHEILPMTLEELERLYDGMIADPSAVSGMRSYYRCKDGSQLPFESSRRVLQSEGGWIIAVISRDIRPRLAAENALRESEARFRSLTALSSDWYWEQDQELRLTFASNLEGLGLAAADYLGRRRWEQPALNMKEDDWQRHRAQLERREPFRDFEIERPLPGGGSIWVSLSGEPVLDAAGRFTGYRGVGRDITRRKRAERDIAHLGRLYAALGAANEAVLRARSPAEVFERACEIAVIAGDFVLGTVLEVDAAAGRFSRAAASGEAAALVKDAAPQLEVQAGGLLDQACRSGVRAVSNDYANDARNTGRGPLADAYRVGSAAAFPLHAGGKVVAVFGLQHVERDAFGDELLALLQRLADNISFALESFRRERQRKKASRGLRESEARFRSLTDLADMYWQQDEEYRFTAMSGMTPGWLEAGRNRMMGKRRWEQHYFNMNEAAWAAHRADLDARRPFRDLELGRVNEAGERVWISVSGEPVFDDAGAFRGYHGIGKDITARKRAALLRELEHTVTRSLAAADTLPAALRGAIRAVCEAEGWECGRYFAVDPRAGMLSLRAAWGVEQEPVQRFLAGSAGITYRLGEGLAGRVWESGQPLWVSDVHEDERSSQQGLARATGMHSTLVLPVRAGSRTIGVLGFNSRSVRRPDEPLLQAIGVIGSQIGQFAQRKQAEEEMRESEARFRGLTSLSSDWYWELDADFHFTTFEGRGRGDYNPAALVVGRRVWELDALEESLDRAALRALFERHEPFRDIEYSYRDRAGRRFYIRSDGEPVFKDGRFAGYRGTSRDITQQRRDEEDLRRFRAAMDMSLDAIYLTDRSAMRFLDVNRVGCKSLGYTLEQLLRMGPHEVLNVPREALEREYDAVIAEGSKALRVEAGYLRGDGRRGWSELHRRALRSGDSWIIVTISRDITERKRAEERQAAYLRYQERIARFGQSALVKREPAEVVQGAVQAVLEALGAEAVAYVEREPGAGGVVLRAVVGVTDDHAGAVDAAAGSSLAEVLASGMRKLAAGGALPFAWAHGLASAALVPVRGEDEVRGALCVCYRSADAFGAEELNFCDAAASVLSTALQRIDSEGRLAYLAQFDPLTGLPNRSLLADRFSQMIIQARRHQSRLAALFIDLDGFKQVNDTLGHAGGDALLKEVAVRLQATVRSGDTVARISGDEFAVILGDVARAEDAATVAQKIIDRLGATVDIGGKEVFVTASVGIASFPDDGADAEGLIGAADAAMYRAKQSGRNSYQFFTAEINQRTRARAQMGAELRRALERDEFALHYQPKVDLATRKPTGVEALLRWKHPARGMVSPAEFIPVLEETGLIMPVGDWVLGRACEDLKAWQAAGLAAVPVAVNLSARQFRNPELDRSITALVSAAGVDPGLVELEITESQLMQDPDQAIRVMRSLRDAGMRLAIDDFGTGYSSLAYLRRFPVAALKIDRSFVKDLSSEEGDATIVRTIIEMARSLGFTVVAEGVETEAQARFLRLLRCEQAQGYLFARPLPAGELVSFLAPR